VAPSGVGPHSSLVPRGVSHLSMAAPSMGGSVLTEGPMWGAWCERPHCEGPGWHGALIARGLILERPHCEGPEFGALICEGPEVRGLAVEGPE